MSNQPNQGPQPSSLFGGVAAGGGGLFGSKPIGSLSGGQQPGAPAGGGLFGAPGQNPAKPADAGAGMLGGGLFGAPAAGKPEAAKTSLFGGGPTSAPPSSSLVPPAGGSGGQLFGMAKDAKAGVFGGGQAPAPAPAQSSLFGGSSTSPGAAGLFAQKAGGANPGQQPAKEDGKAAGGGLFGGKTGELGINRPGAISIGGALKQDKPSSLLGGGGAPRQAESHASTGIAPGGPSMSSLLGAGNLAKKEEAKGAEVPILRGDGVTEAKPLVAEAPKDGPKPGVAKPDKKAEEMQKWQEDFGKNSLLRIRQKWNDQLVRNQKEFDNSAGQLQEYELKLIRQLKAIESIEQTSASVVDQCKHNIRDLTEVQSHQNVVMDELSAIENELDKILPQYQDHYSDNFWKTSAQGSQITDETERMKGTVFAQASAIADNIDTLDEDLRDVQHKIEDHQNKHDRDLKYRALAIGAGGSTADLRQRGRYGADYPGQNSAEQAVEDIEKILGVYYDTIKWVQGSAIELQFQTQELEQKINAQGQQQRNMFQR